MAITNTKNNFFARLLGKDNFGRKISTENNQAAAGMRTSPQFQNQPIPELQPQGGNPFQQGQQPQQGAAPAPQGGQSRYAMYEMMQPKPTRDTEQEGIIQRRAKMNAFSKGFSGLAGLAGVAAGGDAPFVPDGVTPFNMNQLQVMDNDYRNRLQDWTNRGFQVDQANTGLQNREVDQTIDQENRIAVQQQRAGDALNQLLAKSEADQIREMESVGINPYGENAYDDYLKAKGLQFKTEINRKKQIGSRNGRTGPEKPKFDIPTLQRGKKAMIDQLEAQKQGLDSFQDKGQLEAIEAQLKQVREYNPGKNELMDAEVMNMGIQGDEGSQASTPQGVGQPFTPGQGFNIGQQAAGENLTEKEKMAIMSSSGQKVIQNASKINAFDFENEENQDPETAQFLINEINDLLNAGIAENEEEAIDMILSLAKRQN
jgi:hypothetical protein